jgi:GT2 family glycosyltransferase
VLNRNKRALLEQCLLHLQQQSHPPAAVILVDDASTDDSVQMAESAWPGIRAIVMPEPSGVTAARNAGLACVLNQVESDYICFLDNDAFLAPSALAEMVAAASEPDIGMVTPKAFQSMEDRILASAGGMTVNLYLGLFRDAGSGETDLGQYDTPCDVRACPGFALFVPTNVARRAGPFDARLKRYGWEDVDYSLRIAELGFRLRYAPKAEVEHRGGHAGRGIVASYEYWKLRNLFVLMHRHATPMQWACFVVILPLRCLYILLRLIADQAGARRVLPGLKRLATLIGVQ